MSEEAIKMSLDKVKAEQTAVSSDSALFLNYEKQVQDLEQMVFIAKMSALQVVAYQTFASMAEIDVIIGQAKKDALESVKAQEAADAAERHATNVAVAAKEAEEIAKASAVKVAPSAVIAKQKEDIAAAAAAKAAQLA